MLRLFSLPIIFVVLAVFPRTAIAIVRAPLAMHAHGDSDGVDASSTTEDWGSATETTQESRAPYRTIIRHRDHAGRTVKIERNGDVVELLRDGRGLVTDVEESTGRGAAIRRVAQYEYYASGLLEETKLYRPELPGTPWSTALTLTYHPGGQLDVRELANGCRVEHDYDLANRLQIRTDTNCGSSGDSHSTTYWYDDLSKPYASGRLTYVQGDKWERGFGYDVAGRTVETYQRVDQYEERTFSTYDLRGLRELYTVEVADGLGLGGASWKLRSQADALGRPVLLTAGDLDVSLAYDASSSIETAQLSWRESFMTLNEATLTETRSPFGPVRERQLVDSQGTAVFWQKVAQRDDSSRLVGMLDYAERLRHQYGYDYRGRLGGVSYAYDPEAEPPGSPPGTSVYLGTLDFQNRGWSIAYTYDPNNTTGIPNQSEVFDASGNVLRHRTVTVDPDTGRPLEVLRTEGGGYTTRETFDLGADDGATAVSAGVIPGTAIDNRHPTAGLYDQPMTFEFSGSGAPRRLQTPDQSIEYLRDDSARLLAHYETNRDARYTDVYFNASEVRGGVPVFRLPIGDTSEILLTYEGSSSAAWKVKGLSGSSYGIYYPRLFFPLIPGVDDLGKLEEAFRVHEPFGEQLEGDAPKGRYRAGFKDATRTAMFPGYAFGNRLYHTDAACFLAPEPRLLQPDSDDVFLVPDLYAYGLGDPLNFSDFDGRALNGPLDYARILFLGDFEESDFTDYNMDPAAHNGRFAVVGIGSAVLASVAVLKAPAALVAAPEIIGSALANPGIAYLAATVGIGILDPHPAGGSPLDFPGPGDDIGRGAKGLLSQMLGQTGGAAGKAPIWTATKNLNPVENAFRHFGDHGAEFGARNALDHVTKAQEFLRTPPRGTLSKVRGNGDVVRYDPATNTFGVMDASGAPRTMFKPDPAAHKYPSNLDYYNAQ